MGLKESLTTLPCWRPSDTAYSFDAALLALLIVFGQNILGYSAITTETPTFQGLNTTRTYFLLRSHFTEGWTSTLHQIFPSSVLVLIFAWKPYLNCIIICT